MLKQLLAVFGISVITETDIPTSNQRIDFVITNNDKAGSLFNYAKKLIIGEFKSENDKLHIGDLLMLISKAFNYIALTYGYGGKKSELDSIELSNASVILFLGGKKKASKFSTLDLEMKELEKGVYEIINGLIHVIIVEIDYVELSDQFIPLKIFANEQIRKKTMAEAIENDNIFIKSVAYFLYKEELLALAKAKGKSITPVSLSIRSAVQTIGLSKVIEEVGLSKVIEEVGLSKVIDEVGLSKVIEEVGLSKVIEEVSMEELFSILSQEQLDKLIEMRERQNK